MLANDGYGFNIADDASLIWLDPSKRTPATLQSTLTDLQAASTALGIQTILGRNDLTKYYRDPATDSRTPDFFVVSQKGVIYTGGTKLAEHGGVADDDHHVALLVSAPGLNGVQVGKPVFTTQIAPTILSVFGISPDELQAVQIEGTRALPPGLSDSLLAAAREEPGGGSANATQIAPTILEGPGLDPNALDAVSREVLLITAGGDVQGGSGRLCYYKSPTARYRF